jgi:hypothetical protein
MKTVLAVACGLMLSAVMISAQSGNSGTVNQMSNDPQQNQKATGTMGTTTGQPNDITPGSKNSPNGGVPSTTTMTGSGSNGNTQQSTTPGTSTTKSQKKNSKTGNSNKAKSTAATTNDQRRQADLPQH